MTRNDYDSTREVIFDKTFQPSASAPITGFTNIAVYDFPLAVSKLFDYDEYKMSNMQLVLTPLHLANNADSLECDDTGEPYFYVIPRIHPNSWTSTPTLETIKSTPGVMRFHLLRKTPIVINVSPTVPMVQDVLSGSTAAQIQIQEPMKRLTWLHNPQDSGPIVSSNYPYIGSVFFYFPKLVVGTYLPKFKVEWYCTITLRGNRALLEV